MLKMTFWKHLSFKQHDHPQQLTSLPTPPSLLCLPLQGIGWSWTTTTASQVLKM